MYLNSTLNGEGSPQYPAYVNNILISGACLSLFLSVTFNTFAIAVLSKESCGFERTIRWSCILLALNDMMTALIAVTVLSAQSFHHLHLCVVGFECFWISLGLSLYLLGIINVDRSVMISNPLRYNRIMTRRTTIITLIVITVLPPSLIVFILQIKPWPLRDISLVFCNGHRGDLSGDILERMSLYLVIYLIPPVTVTVANVLILRIALKTALRDRTLQDMLKRGRRVPMATSPEEAGQINRENQPGRFKCFRTVLLLTCMTYLSWLPVMLVFSTSEHRGWAFIVANIPTICNSWWNSILYAITNKEYRRLSKNTMRSLFSRNRIDPFH